MQFRPLGRSGLQVSPLAFGGNVFGWTVDETLSFRLLDAWVDAGFNFVDTADVYSSWAPGHSGGESETIIGKWMKARGNRGDIVLTTKVGYDITAERRFPGQSERPHDWRPESVHAQCDASLLRLGIDHIDLYQLHNTRIEPILADDLWDALEELQRLGKVRELGVALGPAIGWVEEGNRAVDERPITSLQTVFNILEQEPGLTFAKRPRVQRGEVGLIARVPHASDTLSGRVTPDTVFDPKDHRSHRNRDNMLDNFEKAETLSFLWEPETGRTIGQAAIAGILANPAFTCVLPTVLTVEDVVEYAASSDLPLTADEKSAVDDLWSRNFDHEDRYVMPLKSSVTSG